jgi:hypothetical protein
MIDQSASQMLLRSRVPSRGDALTLCASGTEPSRAEVNREKTAMPWCDNEVLRSQVAVNDSFAVHTLEAKGEAKDHVVGVVC